MLAEAILALMLAVGPAPGRSTQSLVVVPADTPAPCSHRYDLRCRKPWRSKWHRGQHVRVETYAEGLARYWVIAQAIAQATGENDRLARYLITVTRHESGWRRDVHSGIGPWSKGDMGHSWGLAQFKVGTHPDSPVPLTKYKARDIVGVELAATVRCMQTAASYLDRSLDYCERAHGGPACPFAVYGGAEAGAASRLISQRVATLSKLPAVPPPLADDVRSLLGLD